jgi:hypothetical protein
MMRTTSTTIRAAMALEYPRKLDDAHNSSYYDQRRDDRFLSSLA